MTENINTNLSSLNTDSMNPLDPSSIKYDPSIANPSLKGNKKEAINNNVEEIIPHNVTYNESDVAARRNARNIDKRV